MPEKDRRAGWPFALLTVVCAAAVVGVLTGATAPLSASQFANTGHWVFNSVLGAVFHVDGATTNIDARFGLAAEDGSQVLQSDTSGFVVGRDKITEFDKESLQPKRSSDAPVDEEPVGIEVVGGPYAVYRDAGIVVRLGDPTATVEVGSPVGTPVVTEDGTMWLHRTGDGRICRIEKEGVELAGCPVSAPKDHAGALTLVGGKPAFVDLFTRQLHPVDGDRLGAGVALDVPLSPSARPAERDAGGRLAILDPARDSLVLVDVTGKTPPLSVPLPSGDYDGPVSTGDVVVVVDRQKGTVLTYGSDGKRRDEEPIKDKSGEPRLNRGEDQRIYVEDEDGTQVLVVGEDGGVRGVDVAGEPETPVAKPVTPGNDGPRRDSGRPSAGRPSTHAPAPVPPGRPGAPADVHAQPGNGSATVTWGPAPDNRAAITSYVVTWAGGSATFGPATRRAPIPNLVNGRTYTFSVTATNLLGPGPGVTSNPVTPNVPVGPAAPPVDLRAAYDETARPARDVTLTWAPPALNGGRFARYQVDAPGLGSRQVTATQVVFAGVPATQAVTFTVRAVTTTPDGAFVTGSPATARHIPVPPPRVTVTKGSPSDEHCEDQPGCAYMLVTLSGFEPGTAYHVKPFSNGDDFYSNPGHTTTTDGNGGNTIEQFAFAGPGESVWVEVTLDSERSVVLATSVPYVW